ncbi:sulfotransferase domain-containing protein [Cycloclasticus sp.]|uniref:sulfotransferase domain-containing protein n=1 Tax=Cycloclasticus sp. TaxID=2024830 RepID=UPI000C0F0228|nr:sulfotransferase domain-containing protein [Cycloclasticus sp.]PHR50803.1 MAG: hypothetical protein COA48_04960 [Cycloclasticus sp.]
MSDIEESLNQLTLPASKSEAPSVYAFSLHKSGSTLLFNMLARLAPYAGQPYFSLQDQLFSQGIQHNPSTAKLALPNNFFQPKGYLFGGFRFYLDLYNIPNIQEHKKILLIRHPLDVLVSTYFSEVYSHKAPKKGALVQIWQKKREHAAKQSLESFVMDEYKPLLIKILSYKNMLNQPNFKLYRYEDIIYSKKDFLRDIVRFYEWNIADDVLTKIANQFDKFPSKEKKNDHVRQVHPGNYKKHLSYETISALENEFEAILYAFGYKVDPKIAFQRLNELQNQELK